MTRDFFAQHRKNRDFCCNILETALLVHIRA
jgi:hypothetical protein